MTLPNKAGYLVQKQQQPQQNYQTTQNANLNVNGTDFSKLTGLQPLHPPALDPNHFHFTHGEFMHPQAAIGMIPQDPNELIHDHGLQQPHFSNRLTDLFKNSGQENLSQEEITERKGFVRSHRLLPAYMDLLTTCKKESIIPEPQVNVDTFPFGDDFGLEDFLESQGIDTSTLNSEDPVKNAQREEFLQKLSQLQFKYKEEIEKLNKVCNECCSQLIFVLREQSQLRPVGEHEAQVKLQKVKHKFDYVKNQLRVCVCSAISALQKQYGQARKKHKSLPKKATQSLSQWFFEHIQNPYPTEQEKAMLAAAGGLTLTQVNNWFGNKRIRYKRKCLENEAKRLSEGIELPPPGPMDILSSPEIDALNAPPMSVVQPAPITPITRDTSPSNAPNPHSTRKSPRTPKKSKLLMDSETGDDD